MERFQCLIGPTHVGGLEILVPVSCPHPWAETNDFVFESKVQTCETCIRETYKFLKNREELINSILDLYKTINFMLFHSMYSRAVTS
jgi:hypothetical protein